MSRAGGKIFFKYRIAIFMNRRVVRRPFRITKLETTFDFIGEIDNLLNFVIKNYNSKFVIQNL